jgi:glyceraldehyde-3-phosphate dehydrogenase (NADP+)
MSTSSSPSYVPSCPDSSVQQRVASLFASATVPDNAMVEPIHASTYLLNGQLVEWSGKMATVESAICDVQPDGSLKRRVIGDIHYLEKEQAMQLLDSAYDAFDVGRGAWPRATTDERIQCVAKFVVEMQKVREQVVRLLMWEIGKARKESEAEFDRTVKYELALRSIDRSNERT